MKASWLPYGFGLPADFGEPKLPADFGEPKPPVELNFERPNPPNLLPLVGAAATPAATRTFIQAGAVANAPVAAGGFGAFKKPATF